MPCCSRWEIVLWTYRVRLAIKVLVKFIAQDYGTSMVMALLCWTRKPSCPIPPWASLQGTFVVACWAILGPCRGTLVSFLWVVGLELLS